MKRLLLIVVVAMLGYYAYGKFDGGGPPEPIKNPVYAEVRVTNQVQGRELEMALFIRASSEFDCKGRAQISWNGVLDSCPGCTMHEVKCHSELPARYARLFDDVPIPSPYLSATAGVSGERDGRLVVYGLTDEEGRQACEIMRNAVLKSYHGTAHCVPASGG